MKSAMWVRGTILALIWWSLLSPGSERAAVDDQEDFGLIDNMD